MMIISAIVLILGIISLIYYGIIVSYAGMNSSFAIFWLLFGTGCILLFFVIKYFIKHDISVSRPLRLAITAVIAAGLCIFILIEGIIIYHANQKAEPGMDYLIVLGAQVRGTRITRTLKKRLDTAASYLKSNPAATAIVSGGQGTGEDISEAEAMKRYLQGIGIDESRIIKEDASTNTNENIRFSKNLIINGQAKVAVVTNGFHVFRAVSIARRQGFQNIEGLSAPSDPILLVNYYVREVIGVMKDWVFGNL